jgi:hypothetical protein
VRLAKFHRTELVRAEPVFLHVGFTVDAMSQKMFAAYQLQVFTADTAANEVDAIASPVAAEFWVASSSDALRRFTVAGRVKSGLHRWRRYIRRERL